MDGEVAGCFQRAWLVAGVGDSRAWLVTPSSVTQVTEDDNVAAQLVRSGKLTAAQALDHPGRHWITRAIGPEEVVAPHIAPVRLLPGEALLIASDGLEPLTTDDIRGLLAGSPGAREAAERLVGRALRKGAADNVTAVVVRHVTSSGDEPAG